MDATTRKKYQALYLSGERELATPGKKAKAAKTEAVLAPAPTIAVEKPSAAPFEMAPLPSDPAAALTAVSAEIGDCKRCRLCEQRTNIVFGVGNPQAQLMFVGEGPGRDEDAKGEPFVGRAGQLLTKIIEAMGLQRSDVYIANVVKCRPPENRNPMPDEIATCSPFLMRQLEIIRPKIIVCLGNFAVQTVLMTEDKISGLRGKFHAWPNPTVKQRWTTTLPENAIQVMPTYHPAFLLRNPNMKKPVWEDMQQVMKELGLTPAKAGN